MKATLVVALFLLGILILGLSFRVSQTQAQNTQDSPDLAKFAALMQYIRSTPTPSDVKANNIPLLATLNTALSDIYITGFITPYTGETADQVKARLQSISEEDRFTAVMVESYRLSPDPLLLDIVHQLLPLYYVEFFTTADGLDASEEFLKRADIESLAAAFDSTDYAIPVPSTTSISGGTSPSTRSGSDVDSDDLASFVAILHYIRSTPTPSDVKANNLPLLATLDTALSEIYITGFITPYTAETADQVKARLQSISEEDRFTAVMVESYRLSPNPLLLDIVHQLLPLYYVEFFTTADGLDASEEFIKRDDIESLAAVFDPTNYAIHAPYTVEPPEDGGSPETDRAALVALYNTTDGENWTNNSNWLTDEPLDEWYGVGTDESGRVTWLSLWDSQLNGPIPPELGYLTNLGTLDLSSNQLSGPIPSSLGNLANLMELSLGHNQLTGSIPSQLGELSNLQWLYLSGNQLTGCIPNALGSTQNDFSRLGLSFCSPRASDPSDRAVLEVFYNAADGPNWRSRANWLSDKPLSLWHGVTTNDDGQVTVLSLWRNHLSGSIPPELGNLTNLELLYLHNNQLSGAIPPELGNLTDLREMHLQYNQLSGAIPPELGDLPNLVALLIEGNQFSGCIPDALRDVIFWHDAPLELPFCSE